MVDAAEQARQQMWASSERSYHERRRLELRESWREYHEAQAMRIEKLARALVEEHRLKAQALLHQPSAKSTRREEYGPSVEASQEVEKPIGEREREVEDVRKA